MPVGAHIHISLRPPMSQIHTEIQCPKCHTKLDVNHVLAQQLKEELTLQFEAQARKDREGIHELEQKLVKEREHLATANANMEETIAQKVQKTLKSEEEILRKKLATQLKAEQEERWTLLQQELEEKSSKLRNYHKALGQVEQLKREKEELKDKIKAESQAELSKQLSQERKKIQKQEADRHTLTICEKEKVIDQLKEQLSIAQRKADQGSTQLQGEVQELAIEEWLREQFPLDEIEEIKKGVRGADCLQKIHTRNQDQCGTIYYESKRTQNFKKEWIEKFKADIQEKKADIGVLITQAMPQGMDRMGLIDGVWVCSFEEFKTSCTILRDSLIRFHHALKVRENQGDKMVMLYDFLTGNEFRMQVESIVEGFSHLKEDLEKEKRAMAALWKKREKQLDKVLINTSHMYSSIEGIAGGAVKPLATLELPEPT